jgi:MFS family permease
MSDRRVTWPVIWALGATQIIGYGTLYYSYSILAPAVAAELASSLQWVFGVLSASLLAGALLAPSAGRWADRFGAGRLMVPGSIAAALALIVCALAPGKLGFAAGVFAMEVASCFVLYSTAFVAIVQLDGPNPQRSIVHLTLIAGFASTLFWPITTWLTHYLDWRQILLVFAALHLAGCLPIHAWLYRRAMVPTWRSASPAAQGVSRRQAGTSLLFWLMLGGFAVEGFVLSAILVHMVPLMTAVGLGSAGVIVASLFGPSQVASRFVNMLFGRDLRQTWLAVIATALLAAGLFILVASAPSIVGAAAFAIAFGLGSGLLSIVGGTLPLELFGRDGYGGHVGWITGARQASAAFAPFGLTFLMERLGAIPALWLNGSIGLAGVAAFAAIVLMHRRMRNRTFMPAVPLPAKGA